MKSIPIFLILFLLTISASYGQKQNFFYRKDGGITGQMLLTMCRYAIALRENKTLTSKQKIAAFSCSFYIDGVIDGHSYSKYIFAKLATNSKQKRKEIIRLLTIACPKPRLTKGKVIRIIVKHLERSPQRKNMLASIYVIDALNEEFPCKEAK